MFIQFESHFRRDAALSRPEEGGSLRQIDEPQLKELFLRFGGMSFNDGLYRVMATSIFGSAQAFIAEAFADFASRVKGFGFDWLGRIFALDPGRLEGGVASRGDVRAWHRTGARDSL